MTKISATELVRKIFFNPTGGQVYEDRTKTTNHEKDVSLSLVNLTLSDSRGAAEPGTSPAAEPSITVCRHFGV